MRQERRFDYDYGMDDDEESRDDQHFTWMCVKKSCTYRPIVIISSFGFVDGGGDFFKPEKFNIIIIFSPSYSSADRRVVVWVINNTLEQGIV